MRELHENRELLGGQRLDRAGEPDSWASATTWASAGSR